ncbi:MAG: tyrosine-type recombinase/integrase [Rhodospirillaceae bacterium]|nr:tyrosine-type recombinase/integrase [Rhodospirillaceae bacterium]
MPTTCEKRIFFLEISPCRLYSVIGEVLERYEALERPQAMATAADPEGWLLSMMTGATPPDPTPDDALTRILASGPARPAAELAKASMAKNTRRAYEAALRGFERSGRPETDAGVAAYLGDLYEEGLSAACAAMAVAALRFRAKLNGRPSPVGAAAERVLAGFRRMASERGRGQVAGMRWEQADRAASMAERSGGPAGLRDAAIISVASDALLRVSEVAALDVRDVNTYERTVLVRRSKTDQEGEGVVQFLGGPTVARVRAWLLGVSLTEGPLFRAVHRSGRVQEGRLTKRSIRRIVTRWGRAAGVEGRISGHSLRVGSAQSLASAGASLVEMQLAGRWRSPVMPGRYAQGQLAQHGAVAKLRYGL